MPTELSTRARWTRLSMLFAAITAATAFWVAPAAARVFIERMHVGSAADAVVAVSPDGNLLSLAREFPEGTTFQLTAGLHLLHDDIQPKTGQSFIGEPGAVIDGRNITRQAFTNRARVTDVTIQNIELRNFAPGIHHGVIDFDQYQVVREGAALWETVTYAEPANWLLKDLWIHHNDGDGVEVGSGGRLVNVRVTDNQWLGIGGHGQDIVIDGGEVARNSLAATDGGQQNHHAGGMKLTRAMDLTISHVHVHNNLGPGIWLDLEVRDSIVSANLVEDNSSRGIFVEISHGVDVVGNVVRRSGTNDPTPQWVWPGGIVSSTSTDVLIADNHVEGALGGISLIDQRSRRESSMANVPPGYRDGRPFAGEHHVVRGNVVCSGPSDTGMGSDGTSSALYDTATWEGNRYFSTSFRVEDGGRRTFDAWRAAGYDTDAAAEVLSGCPTAADPRR